VLLFLAGLAVMMDQSTARAVRLRRALFPAPLVPAKTANAGPSVSFFLVLSSLRQKGNLMPNEIELNHKEQSLIAVGASVAVGCQPCTAYHIKAARTAGACDRSIALAIETAVSGRKSATTAMDEWAELCQGARPEIEGEFRAQKRLIAELTSVATAVAVNSVPDLQKHLTTARDIGARPEQIQVAIEIARKIKRVAEEKIAAITDRMGEDAPSVAAAAEPGCCGSSQVDPPEVTAGAQPGCGCR
jgi:AhpD family alkylhydroperoxidase